MVAARVCFDNAGIHGKPLALDKTGIHARPDYSFENLAKNIALAEPAMTIDRKSRMIGNIVLEIEPAKPAIAKVQFDFLAQLAFRTDPIAVTDNEHPQHEFGINRRSANFAVEGLQFVANIGQYSAHERIDPTQEMVRRNALFEVE